MAHFYRDAHYYVIIAKIPEIDQNEAAFVQTAYLVFTGMHNLSSI